MRQLPQQRALQRVQRTLDGGEVLEGVPQARQVPRPRRDQRHARQNALQVAESGQLFLDRGTGIGGGEFLDGSMAAADGVPVS